MATKKFSKGEALRFGWKAMKSNLLFFIILLLVLWGVSLAFQGMGKLLQDKTVLLVVTSIISGAVQIILGMGVIKLMLQICDNQKPNLGELSSCLPKFLNYLLGSIVYGLAVAGGLILLVIPGIFLAIRLQFFSYLIVDKGLGPIEALNKSYKMTKGSGWNLFLLWLLLLGINILGLIAIIIGLFASIPTTMVAMAFVYRKLAAQASAA